MHWRSVKRWADGKLGVGRVRIAKEHRIQGAFSAPARAKGPEKGSSFIPGVDSVARHSSIKWRQPRRGVGKHVRTERRDCYLGSNPFSEVDGQRMIPGRAGPTRRGARARGADPAGARGSDRDESRVGRGADGSLTEKEILA